MGYCNYSFEDMRTIKSLMEGVKTATDVSEELGLSIPAAVRHLRRLERHDLVIADKVSRSVYYSLKVLQAKEAIRVYRNALRLEAEFLNSFD